MASARIREQFVIGVSRLYEADSVLDAKETMEAYLCTTEKLDTSQKAGQIQLFALFSPFNVKNVDYDLIMSYN